jgi:UDP-glucose 4-epimerase
VYGDGKQTRPQLHVSDASGVIRFALAHPDQMAGSVYNVVGENASVLALVDALRALRPGVDVRYTEQDVLTHLSFAADGSRLNGLGWYPQVSLEAGLAELLDHMRAFEPFRSAGTVDLPD